MSKCHNVENHMPRLISISEFAWRQWPDGDYAIPMPVFGCPDQELNNWKHRSIMINYREYSWTLIDGIAANMTIRHNLRHLGSIIKDVFEIRLCVKQRTRAKTSPLSNSYEKWQHQLSESAEWPRGKYDVYKTSDNCPTGELAKGRLSQSESFMFSITNILILVEFFHIH